MDNAKPFLLCAALLLGVQNPVHAADPALLQPQTAPSSARSTLALWDIDVWLRRVETNASGSQPDKRFSGDVRTDSLSLQMRRLAWTWGFSIMQSDSSFETPDTRGRRGESIASVIPYLSWQATPYLVLNGYVGYSGGTSDTLQSPMGPVEGSRKSHALLTGIGGTLNLPLAGGLLSPTLQYSRSAADYSAYEETRTFDDGNVTRFPRASDRVVLETVAYGARYARDFGPWSPNISLMAFNRTHTTISDEATSWMQSSIGVRYTVQPRVHLGAEYRKLHQHQWEQASSWVFFANAVW